MKRYVLGLDEGTTSLRAVLYDIDANKIVLSKSSAISMFYPQDAWVEQDAEEIYQKLVKAARAVLKSGGVKKEELLAVALTNQREAVVAWDKLTGKPVTRMIGWQCRRTSAMLKKLSLEEREEIKLTTGLIANPYFSASKMKWILENSKEARALARKNQLCFGTVDSFLCHRLTGNFCTDTTNASRTMLMDIHTLDWDSNLLKKFHLSRDMLPKILPCDANFGKIKKFFDAPLLAIIGDQQASMVGQGAIFSGDSKVTFGTGGFVLTNLGEGAAEKTYPNLITTVARTLGGKTDYAIEGSIYSACSAVNFLEKLGFFKDVQKTAEMAKSLPSNEGVYFVPAFTGLGAPYWKDDARGAIFGMTYDTTKAHIVRACLESMAYNTKAVFDELKSNGQKLGLVSVDGGGSKNDFLLQFLADISNHSIVKSKESEATALGAIYVALENLGLVNKSKIKQLTAANKVFEPQMTESERKKLYEGWVKAIKKV